MTPLGSSAPTVCTCGHDPDDHIAAGCIATEIDEWGYDSCCDCPLFERDEDR